MSSKLKEAREKAGYTIEEVAEKLNIRKQYIVFLEEGNLDGIPGKVYAEGYTKLYSEFFGIESPIKSIKAIEKPLVNNISNQQKIKRKYIIFFSAILLVLVILAYSMLKTSKIEMPEIVEDELIQNIQEHDGSNQEEFDRSDS